MTDHNYSVEIQNDYTLKYSDMGVPVVFPFDLEGGEDGGLVLGRQPEIDGGRSHVELQQIRGRIKAFLEGIGHKVR